LIKLTVRHYFFVVLNSTILYHLVMESLITLTHQYPLVQQLHEERSASLSA
jgi:hypothetical protein